MVLPWNFSGKEPPPARQIVPACGNDIGKQQALREMRWRDVPCWLLI
jgi:hypothetical protein